VWYEDEEAIATFDRLAAHLSREDREAFGNDVSAAGGDFNAASALYNERKAEERTAPSQYFDDEDDAPAPKQYTMDTAIDSLANDLEVEAILDDRELDPYDPPRDALEEGIEALMG